MVTEKGQTLEKWPFWTIYETSEYLLLRIRYTYTAEYQRIPLTHIILAFHLWESANSGNPDQTPQNAVSDQGLLALLTRCLNFRKEKYDPTTIITEKDWSGR